MSIIDGIFMLESLQKDVSQQVLLTAAPPWNVNVQRLFPQDRRTLEAKTPF